MLVQSTPRLMGRLALGQHHTKHAEGAGDAAADADKAGPVTSSVTAGLAEPCAMFALDKASGISTAKGLVGATFGVVLPHVAGKGQGQVVRVYICFYKLSEARRLQSTLNHAAALYLTRHAQGPLDPPPHAGAAGVDAAPTAPHASEAGGAPSSIMQLVGAEGAADKREGDMPPLVVSRVLSELDMQEYLGRFRAAKIDEEVLRQLRRDDLCRHLQMPLGDVMKIWTGLLSAGAVSAVPPARPEENDLADVAAGREQGLVPPPGGGDCGGDMDDEMEQVMAEMREIRAELRQLRGKLLPGKEIGPGQGP